MSFSQPTYVWRWIKEELRRGRKLEDLSVNCDACGHRVETSAAACDGIIFYCGHVLHDYCLETMREYARRNPYVKVTCPCCMEPVRYHGCSCMIPSHHLPYCQEQAEALPPTLPESGFISTHCLTHAIENAVGEIGIEALKRLGRDKQIGVTDDTRITCLISAQEGCIGYRGTLAGRPQYTKLLDDVCEQQRNLIRREFAGSWGDFGRTRVVPKFQVAVIQQETADMCWNCRRPNCKNGYRQGKRQ